jgi:xylulokinase
MNQMIQKQDLAGKYLIGLDMGTSAIKGVLMSAEGIVISRENAKTVYQKEPDGVVQFDAREFYDLVTCVIRNLTKALPKNAAVVGISMASASGNTVLLDPDGEPVFPVFSWTDTRVTDEVEQVFGVQNAVEVHARVGWPLILQAFPLAHLAWLKCHKPEILQSAGHVCMSTDYVNYRLTGCFGIDPSTATTFYLQDQVKGAWYPPYLKLLGIPEEKLPTILPSGTVLGGVTKEAAEQTGLAPGTPVVLGSFDHPCAARGSGVLEEGKLLLSCGTSWVGFYTVKNRELALSQGLLVDPFLNPREELWGTMFAFSSIAVLVDEYIGKYIAEGSDRYRLFDSLAASAKPGSNGLFINIRLPQQADQTDRYSKADIARAIMEGTGYLLKSKIDQLAEAGLKTTSVVMVGGPSETFPWPQIVCDILGVELSIINGSCAGAAGSAILAGIGAGLYSNERDAFHKATFEKIIRKPDGGNHEIYSRLYPEFVKQMLQ